MRAEYPSDRAAASASETYGEHTIRIFPLLLINSFNAGHAIILSEEEKAEMYDMAGKQRNAIAPDLPEYIMEREYVSAALRTARDLDAGEAEWREFIEKLKKGKSD